MRVFTHIANSFHDGDLIVELNFNADCAPEARLDNKAQLSALHSMRLLYVHSFALLMH